jgi:translation initiation factor IF-1
VEGKEMTGNALVDSQCQSRHTAHISFKMQRLKPGDRDKVEALEQQNLRMKVKTDSASASLNSKTKE